MNFSHPFSRGLRRLAGFRPYCALLCVNLLLGSTALQAQEGKIYLGIGGGQSRLSPNIFDSGFHVSDDDSDITYKFTVGYDLTDFWSIEAFYSDLGLIDLTGPTADERAEPVTGINPLFPLGAGSDAVTVGNIDYRAYGVQTFVQIPGNKAGYSGLLKLGLVQMDTSGHNLPFSQKDTLKLLGGVGTEYQFKNGVSVRAEYEYYDEHAQLITFSVIKRLDAVIPLPWLHKSKMEAGNKKRPTVAAQRQQKATQLRQQKQLQQKQLQQKQLQQKQLQQKQLQQPQRRQPAQPQQNQ